MKRILPFFLLLFLASCGSSQKQSNERVVLYCSVDDVYAKPIIKKLEEKTGLQIDVLYDTEAAKTAGLANRIRAEAKKPRGDVFWSSALLQTLLLSREGLLDEYLPKTARYTPPQFRSDIAQWTGLGVRARVLVYHQSVKNPPRSLNDLLKPEFKNKVGISNPQFGTGSDWASALAVRWGEAKTLDYFRNLKKNGVRILPGNSVVADRVARGELLAGVTDTDDYLATAKKFPALRAVAIEKLRPEDVLVPGSVAIMKNAPHKDAAKKLADALLEPETERLLVEVMRGVEPTRSDVAPHSSKQESRDNSEFHFPTQGAPDDAEAWHSAWDKIREPLAEILLSD